MKTLAELEALIEAAQPHDGDDIDYGMRKLADAHMTLLRELAERIKVLDAAMEKIFAAEQGGAEP